MPLHTEHLEVVVRSLHTALQSIEFESSSPALASWRSARMLIDLADDGGRTPSESAACLAVACDLLAFAEKSACGDESSSMLGVTLSSVVDLLGIHQLTEQVQGQEAEHAMSINGALLEFGVMEDQDACFMTGALRGIVARSTPVILWAAASLIVRKDALLRRWLEACQIPELSSTKTGEEAQAAIVPRSDESDVAKSLARARERKVTLIEKKPRPSREKSSFLRSPWKRRTG
ncbi:MAG: hypothetical protein L7V86_10810 [Verrucomicrobiales bacterium]|jgi:hypothetical protein|nr:hypothetical protein [Verrucomicrobiales bacterium]MDA7644283.1 hypothetical protein [Verrucomicrobiales bacterium]MDB2327218.1 hypothetical protein [bacterium]MDF1788240.1 hypothetical protein [Verrucomicrobiales bacterium]